MLTLSLFNNDILNSGIFSSLPSYFLLFFCFSDHSESITRCHNPLGPLKNQYMLHGWCIPDNINCWAVDEFLFHKYQACV